ncbi:MAG: succinylglutamate desuccinylase/aspartoacylase family protein [Deltaproteobacteria bacterium]|nr:succinylglutamate desuccinylase/aspartoacylase family protein [Deltaproteobacteria bacterium]
MCEPNTTKRAVTHVSLPSMTPGNVRTITVHRFGESGAKPKVYLQAGLHGNEHPGLLVLHHLLRNLDTLSKKGSITGQFVIVPLVNPIGLSQFIHGELVGRFDFFSGHNFNRDFPNMVDAVAARIVGQLSESAEENQAMVRKVALEILGSRKEINESAEMRRLIMLMAMDADIAIDLHADGQSLLHCYTHPCHKGLADELGAQLGAEAILLGADREAYSFDDTLNLFWVDLAERFPDKPLPPACFAATIELRGRIDVVDVLAKRDADNLIRFFMRRGAISGDPGPLPPLKTEIAKPLNAVYHGRAPASGVAVFHKKLGDWVKSGEIVADIVDPAAEHIDQARHPVASATDGLFFSQNLVKFVRAGQTFFKIAGNRVLNDRQTGFLED